MPSPQTKIEEDSKMTAVTKEDLDKSHADLKSFINEKFDEHEKREKLMFGPLSETVGEHEDILRGRDRTSGIIKKINYLWVIAGSGSLGTAWAVWKFLASK